MDLTLHKQFCQLGKKRHALRNQLLAMLPEIQSSGVWRQFAGSIVEYAGKYGDISPSSVRKCLRLHRRLQNKPYLRAAIKQVGIHKVALVAEIATEETDKVYASHASTMSKQALIDLAKEVRRQDSPVTPCNTPKRLYTITIDEASMHLLQKLKRKLGKHMSDKALLYMLLKERSEMEFPTKKPALKPTPASSQTAGRYIPLSQRRAVLESHQERCAYPGCAKLPEVFHHRDRYSRSKSHESIVPLCHAHHDFAHHGLIRNEQGQPEMWQFTPSTSNLSKADRAMLRYRSLAIPS